MNNSILLISLFSLLALFSCSDKEEELLRQFVKSEYQDGLNKQHLNSGIKVQYINMEQTLNREYVSELEILIDSRFDRQIESLENNELGVWRGYMNMFSWLFMSKQSWDDEMVILSNKYFNPLDNQQEQYELYLKYSNRIKELRSQFIEENNLPLYHQIDIPSQDISLGILANHSRNNIIIELGTELFGWFLAFIIIQIILLIVDGISAGTGCIIHIIVAIITIIVSIIMTTFNDSKLVDSLKSQHEQSIDYDYHEILKNLSSNTIHFYEGN